ncbi:TPA: RnfABCDGE type electron transport complex subunit D [bacterium]|nr:RnfABCDGE type electron transport complex subunit D [bacterium]
MQDDGLLTISTSPHIKDKESIPKIMWTVVISLLPAVFAGTYVFGFRVLLIILIGVISAVGTEALIQYIFHREITVYDGSAVVTGMLLAMVIPPGVPLWMSALGSFFAIALAKAPFGGLGYNIFNPALIGRAILLASFPVVMTTWQFPMSMQTAISISSATNMPVDSITGATTLGLIKRGSIDNLLPIWNLFIGKSGGSIGETSDLALLIGATILLLKRYITWHIPISFIGTVAIIFGLTELFGDKNFIMIPIQLFSGGLTMGAFFMATDMVTSPITKKGGLIFGIGAGIITCVIRILGGYPEGVCYSILLMNAFTPLIDRYIKPKRFGIKSNA